MKKIAFSLAVSASFEGLAVMANVAAFLLYALCCAAAWELVRRDVRTDGKPFGFPGAQVFPFVAIAFVVALLVGALMSDTAVGSDTRAAVKICAMVLAIGSVLFFLRRMLAANTNT